jgi:hypothetical protein
MRSLVYFITSLSLVFSSAAFLSQTKISRAQRILFASRYGPPLSPDDNVGPGRKSQDNDQTKVRFRKLLEESAAISNPDHLPKLLANNMEVIVSLQGNEGAKIVSDLVEEAKTEGVEQFERTVMMVDTILTFAETFVEQASEIDMKHKKLLGSIIKTMTSKSEDALDELMEAEKNNFSAGFLRHIEGECDRIVGAPRASPDSAKLLELLRIIQTRVLEELGSDMGEATLVLGQLMGYDDKDELLGVLDAGLTVQGREFALEMAVLTEEALKGFQSVHDGVDPELVERVKTVDLRLKDYLEETNQFQ